MTPLCKYRLHGNASFSDRELRVRDVRNVDDQLFSTDEGGARMFGSHGPLSLAPAMHGVNRCAVLPIYILALMKRMPGGLQLGPLMLMWAGTLVTVKNSTQSASCAVPQTLQCIELDWCVLSGVGSLNAFLEGDSAIAARVILEGTCVAEDNVYTATAGRNLVEISQVHNQDKLYATVKPLSTNLITFCKQAFSKGALEGWFLNCTRFPTRLETCTLLVC